MDEGTEHQFAFPASHMNGGGFRILRTRCRVPVLNSYLTDQKHWGPKK